MALAPGIIAALTDIVGTSHLVVLTDPSTIGFEEAVDALVHPGTTSEVAQVIRGAMACDVSVVTGGGSVLCDGDCGRIAVDLARFDQIVDIDRRELTARVQPQLGISRLYQVVTSAGLTIGHLPRSGPLTDTSDVLAVEAVSQSGRVIRASRPPGGGGFDAVDLLIRLEGFLCVITELVVALVPESRLPASTAIRR